VRLLRRALILAVLVASLASAATAGPLPNACSLVADSQVTAALGGEVRHRAPHATNGARMCVWQRRTFDVDRNPQLTLTVLPLTRDKFTSKWNRPIPDVRPVPGVGEMAYAINGGLWLVAWARGIEVVVNTTDLTTPLETAKRVAKVALTRL
jgi:hypothetical protein